MKKSLVQSTKRKRPVRRTNAERSAHTRRVIMDAAIDLLFTRGHTATTTIAVAARAKVSRGAMLHHFPTRVDMLIAIAEYIVTLQREQRRARAEDLGPGLKRYYARADIIADDDIIDDGNGLVRIGHATLLARHCILNCAYNFVLEDGFASCVVLQEGLNCLHP